MMVAPDYDQNVFINCPFDDAYTPLFEAIVFVIQHSGLKPRCARERLDSSQLRLDKIIELIASSRYSIHDLSRTELDEHTSLPRFNMPLELGIDIGCKRFSPRHRNKSLLVFDAENYRFQKYVSDIAGQDIHYHANDPSKAVNRVRHWLHAETGISIPSGAFIYKRYIRFQADLSGICTEMNFDMNDLSFVDFSVTIARWLQQNA